jgi:hypothetical protein
MRRSDRSLGNRLEAFVADSPWDVPIADVYGFRKTDRHFRRFAGYRSSRDLGSGGLRPLERVDEVPETCNLSIRCQRPQASARTKPQP